jgi:nucleotide-binding universal stress UspA family protein
VDDPWPARALHRVAYAEDAPLIVIGSGHRSAEQLLSGSTAGRVVRHSPCAVAVVPAGYRLSVAPAIDRVGCAFDGSPEADAALAAAVDAAQALHAELEVVWALAAETVLEHAAAEQFGRALAAASTRVRARPVLAPGAPASVLAARSARVDLLCVGSRGYGPRRSVLWGSVTAQLLRSAACPVVVIPRGAEPTLGRLFAPAAARRVA